MQALHGDIKEEVARSLAMELLNEAACRAWFLRRAHPDGAFCPKCRREVPSERSRKSFWELRRVKCTGCEALFTATTGTVLEGVKIDFRELYALLFLNGCGLTVYQVAEKIGISHQTVRAWMRKFEDGGSVAG